jgi:hypothetical protein
MVRDEIQKLRSQEYASKSEYQKIFITCVEDVKKEMLRKSGVTGLNYYKTNGPKGVMELKNVDHHLLLYLFLKNDKVIEAVYNLLFAEDVKAV